MSAPAASKAFAARREELLQDPVGLGNLRPASLVQCNPNSGKPNCRCAAAEHPPHGPRWILAHRVNGKTRTYAIPESELEDTRAQIAECPRAFALAARRTVRCQREPLPGAGRSGRCRIRGRDSAVCAKQFARASASSSAPPTAHRDFTIGRTLVDSGHSSD